MALRGGEREQRPLPGKLLPYGRERLPQLGGLGYWFAREAWGRGYATESSRAMLELGFRRLGFHRVWGKCDELNAQSARVMEKLGLRYEGTLREHVWLRDHFRSSRIYGMLAGEYGRPPAQG